MDKAEVTAIAKEIAQQVGQQISQVVNTLLQSVGSNTAGTSVETNLDDIAEAERLTKDSMDNSALLFLNGKRTYDEQQQLSLESSRRGRTHKDSIDTITLQALQNAVETANMVSKQAVRHSDIAIDRQWNIDEQGFTVAEILRDETFKDAIAAAVAKSVNEPVAEK